jgi:kynureninase
MVRVCRQMAVDLRAEHAMGEPGITLTGETFGVITREEAAIRMDAQADRWELEIRTGELNLYDRKLMGAAPR